ncbi:MAG: MgtC/SapB family protein [Chloroflexi bacterium]|nr:MgtC/SapB family protein [Chloroflexota bacterium]
MISFTTILLRLGLALVLGAVVGAERESHEHAAGMRTVALVTLGSCLFMIISIYAFFDLISMPHIQLDPSRIASYVVAGIGFLGAGSIFMSRDEAKVKGLTTAATVWVMAAVGLACGAGMVLEAVATTILTLAVLVLLRLLEQAFSPRKSSSTQKLSLETTSATGQLLGSVYDTCTRFHIDVETLEVRRAQEGETVTVICKVPTANKMAQLIGALREISEVRAVHADLEGTQAENSASTSSAGKSS